MKNLNEYSTGYPTSIINSQSQEYQGVIGPYDAETARGKEDVDPMSSDGMHRINAFLRHYFRKPTLNPHNEIANLRVRLNHLNLDFPFDNTFPIQPEQTFKVGKTEVFGTTPTTDLSKGFDTGSDVPTYTLTIKALPSDEGYHLDAKLSPHNKLTEEMIRKSKRNERIEKIKKIKKIKEDYEVGPRERHRAQALAGGAGAEKRILNRAISARLRLQDKKANNNEDQQ